MDKRTKILEAAIHCFCKDGFHQTTTRKIAKAAKVSNGLINYHFNDTKEIFWEVIDYIYKETVPEVHNFIEGFEGIEKLKKVIEANFYIFVEKHPKYYSCIVLSYYLAPYDKELGTLHTTLHAQALTFITKVINDYRAERKNKKAPKVAAEDLARSIWHEMEGGLLFASVLSEKEYKKWCQAQLRIMDEKLRLVL